MSTPPAPTSRTADTHRLGRWVDPLAASAFTGLAILELSGGFGVLGALAPTSPFTPALAVGALIAVLVVIDRRGRVPWWPGVAMAGYVLTLALSYSTSTIDPAVRGAAVYDGLQQTLYVAVLAVLATTVRRWWIPAVAAVAPMALIALASALNEWVFATPRTWWGFATITTALGEGTTTARHSGPVPDPNFWGRFLVIGLAFALALLWVARQRRAERAARGERRGGLLVAAAATGLFWILVGIYLTGSRGAFIASVVVAISFFLAVGVRMRRIGLGLLACLPLLAVPGIGSRLFSIAGLSDQAQTAAADASMLERLTTQQIAVRMVEANPITGVGPGGYFEAFPNYAAVTGASVSRVVAPHNLYLGLWAEVGIVGLLGWLVVVAFALIATGRAVHATTALDRSDIIRLRPFASAALAAVLGWSTASIFLHMAYVRVVLVVVAIAAALAWQARERATVAAVRPASDLHAVWAWRLPRLISLTVGAAVGMMIALQLPTGSVATTVGYLAPTRPGTYLVDLRTRTAIVPTYAVVVAASGGGLTGAVPIDAQGDNESGLVTLTAKAPDAEAATAALDRAVRQGDVALRRAGMDKLYTLAWQGRTLAAQPAGSRTLGTGGLIGALIGLGLFEVAARLMWRRRDRRRAALTPPGPNPARETEIRHGS